MDFQSNGLCVGNQLVIIALPFDKPQRLIGQSPSVVNVASEQNGVGLRLLFGVQYLHKSAVLNQTELAVNLAKIHLKSSTSEFVSLHPVYHKALFADGLF